MAFWKTLFMICLAVLNLISLSEAREFKVSWKTPSSSDSFDKWAQRNRFQIGDSIVFKYDGKTDSVVEVSEADYKTCNKSSPIKSYDDGNTIITLDRSGLFYFISGAEGHCHKSQKLEVRVLASDHHHHHHHHRHSAFAPAPNHHSPAPAPAHRNGGATLPVRFMGLGSLALALVIALVW